MTFGSRAGRGGGSTCLYVDSITTQRYLLEARKAIVAHAAAPARARRLARPILARLLCVSQQVERDLNSLHALGRLKVTGDEGSFAGLLARVAHLPAGDRAFVRLQLIEAWRWLHVDDTAHSLTAQVGKARRAFAERVRKTLIALNRGHIKTALRHLAQAQHSSARLCDLSVRIGIAITRFKQEAARIVTRAALLAGPKVAG